MAPIELSRTRTEWREIVKRELDLMGAAVMPVATSWRIAKGQAFMLVSDLADVRPYDLLRLAKS